MKAFLVATFKSRKKQVILILRIDLWVPYLSYYFSMVIITIKLLMRYFYFLLPN